MKKSFLTYCKNFDFHFAGFSDPELLLNLTRLIIYVKTELRLDEHSKNYIDNDS